MPDALLLGRWARRCVVLLGVSGLGACTQLPPSESELGEAHQAIVGGELDPLTQYVVSLPGCTGTLVAPNLIATALHCVTPITGDGNISCTAEGELQNPPNGQLGRHLSPQSIAIRTEDDLSLQNGQAATIDAYGAQILSTQSTHICAGDLAFIVLDRSLDLPIAPIRLYEPVSMGEMVSVVGYGLTTDPENLPEEGVTVARRRRDEVRVEAVGMTRDNPNGSGALPRTFALGESVCKGDSGGPAFSSSGALLGVYSTFVGGCTGAGARNFFTLLSEFEPLVLSAYEAAGATPFLEGQSAPGVVPADAGSAFPDADLYEARSPTGEAKEPSRAVSSGFCSVSSDIGNEGGPSGTWLLLSLGASLALRRKSTAQR